MFANSDFSDLLRILDDKTIKTSKVFSRAQRHRELDCTR
jgi:hypothetical protein